jgi:hypothetical protein
MYASTMWLTPMMNFNFMKNISLCFHEHTNSKLNQFLSVSKEAIFRVLQSCEAGASHRCAEAKVVAADSPGWVTRKASS